MDLESTNGTLLNKEKIEAARYYELKPQDVLNFGLSKRDYVVMKVEVQSENWNYIQKYWNFIKIEKLWKIQKNWEKIILNT